ncbi:MAG: hypothetical protein Q9212_007596, partial [Teloschistes hypoglaucus]
PFFGAMGCTSAIVFTCFGAAYGTAKSGVGISAMGVLRPDLIVKSTLSPSLPSIPHSHLPSHNTPFRHHDADDAKSKQTSSPSSWPVSSVSTASSSPSSSPMALNNNSRSTPRSSSSAPG